MLPPRPDADTPDSERKVFAAFERHLPRDWTVFHSRRIVLGMVAAPLSPTLSDARCLCSGAGHTADMSGHALAVLSGLVMKFA